MQLTLLLFLQDIARPSLDSLAELLSLFAEIALPALLILAVYWNISRKKAFSILGTLLAALSLTNALKALFRLPRPFQVHPHLINGKRLGTATGYSFPSGHTATAAATYPVLAFVFEKNWLEILAAVIVIGAGLSRLYLGVHWPLDVLIGALIGLSSALLLPRLLDSLWEEEDTFSSFSQSLGSIALFIALILAMALDNKAVDYTAWSDLCTVLSISGASLLGMAAERRFAGFDASWGSPGIKALRTLLGLSSTALIAFTVSLLPLSHKMSTFTTSTLAVYWASFLYPWLGMRIRLFSDNA